jgi:predicted dehydrogenase
MAEIRWGVLGPGGIAERFAEAMTLTSGGQVAAVASRSIERARTFAERYGAAAAFGSYEDLLADDGVDAIYVAVPHSGHHQLTIDALTAGKHVLCDKPLALDAAQAAEMASVAGSTGRFLMEAMWTRFLPSYRRLVDLMDDGELGRPLLVEADFGFRMPLMPEHRLFDRNLGGGAALDLGIYPLQLCSLLLGSPSVVNAVGHIGSTDVDELVAIVLGHPGGAIGVAKASIRADLSCTARITCEEGSVELPPFMHDARQLRLRDRHGERTIDCEYEGDGLRFEIDEVHRCLDEGMAESSVMPLAESVQLAQTLDAVLAQVRAG